MEQSKRRHLDSLAWREVIGRFAAGGQSVTAFCLSEGVSANSFRRWRARLSPTAEVAMKVSTAPATPATLMTINALAPAHTSHQTAVVGASAPLLRFVDLGAMGALGAAPPAAGSRLELKLELGGGVILHIARG